MTAKQRREAQERRLFTDGWADGAEQGAAAERRRIRRAQRIPIHTLRQALKSLPDADEKAAALNDLEELDAATRAPKRRGRNGR